jgi:NAD(P)-dependent dehydrogenase (short-subunit alcohol dehydrogenase family)
MVNDSIILVTGASRGLGRGIARAFGSKGATVYVTGRHADELGPVVGEIDAAGGRGVASHSLRRLGYCDVHGNEC